MDFEQMHNCCSCGQVFDISSDHGNDEDAARKFFAKGRGMKRLLAIAYPRQISLLRRFGFTVIATTGKGGSIMMRKCTVNDMMQGFGPKKNSKK